MEHRHACGGKEYHGWVISAVRVRTGSCRLTENAAEHFLSYSALMLFPRSVPQWHPKVLPPRHPCWKHCYNNVYSIYLFAIIPRCEASRVSPPCCKPFVAWGRRRFAPKILVIFVCASAWSVKGVVLSRFLFMSIGALEWMKWFCCGYAHEMLSAKTAEITVSKRRWGKVSKIFWIELKE